MSLLSISYTRIELRDAESPAVSVKSGKAAIDSYVWLSSEWASPSF